MRYNNSSVLNKYKNKFFLNEDVSLDDGVSDDIIDPYLQQQRKNPMTLTDKSLNELFSKVKKEADRLPFKLMDFTSECVETEAGFKYIAHVSRFDRNNNSFADDYHLDDGDSVPEFNAIYERVHKCVETSCNYLFNRFYKDIFDYCEEYTEDPDSSKDDFDYIIEFHAKPEVWALKNQMGESRRMNGRHFSSGRKF